MAHTFTRSDLAKLAGVSPQATYKPRYLAALASLGEPQRIGGYFAFSERQAKAWCKTLGITFDPTLLGR